MTIARLSDMDGGPAGREAVRQADFFWTECSVNTEITDGSVEHVGRMPSHAAGRRPARARQLRAVPDPGAIADLVGRAAVAAVWLFHGLWCKLLGGEPAHALIVGSVPGLGAAYGRPALLAIGLLEAGLGLWVLVGRARRLAAGIQLAGLAAMNAGGFIWAGEFMPHALPLCATNAAFALLIVGLSFHGGARGERS